MENIIELESVDFVYGEEEGNQHKAVDGFSLEVKRGEHVAVLGHNGSGKSTLAKLLNGLFVPTNGDIYVKGMNTKDEETLWDVRKTCGMVFQNPDNQMVTTIVEEDVAFGPENLGLPKEEIRKRVDRALETVRMTDFKDRSPHSLSGGQKQRIAIAGVLAMEPEVIVFDEPTSMLDPVGREEVLETIETLNKKEGKTIVQITHFMEEVIFCDRVVVMDSGKKVLEGSPREVFREAELLRSYGLELPQVTELFFELKDTLGLEGVPLTIDEAVELLC